MLRIVTIILLLAPVIAGCAVTAPSRIGAEGLLHELRERQVPAGHYEEYLSFTRTVEAAEMNLRNGRAAEAEELFRLAVAKGYILRQRLPGKEGLTVPSSSPPAPAPPAPDETPEPVAEVPLAPPAAAAAAAARPSGGVKPLPPAVGSSPGETAGLPPRKERRTGSLSERIVGGEGVYQVKRKETLRVVGSKLGVSWRRLARLNRLNPDKPLQPGQKIRYNNRKIVPKKIKDGILVNIPERKLYLFKDDRLLASYPVAAGMAKKKEKTIWRTPTGKFTIVDKRENPSWRVPPSIRKEMEEEGEEVLDIVPPGPGNPLGKYALKTSLSGIMIHSTIRPASIDTFSSHGCIRIMPEHMETLFRDVRVNMPGEIIYQPVKLEVTADGRVFLEVNSDIYEQVKDMKGEVKRLVAKKGAAEQVSWEKIERVVRESSGIAEEVTRKRDVIVATMDRAAE